MRNALILLAVIAAAWHFYNCTGEVELGPGVMAASAPVQEQLDTPIRNNIDGYTITEFASFAIKAKVLSKENYRFGREAELSPADLALGWGNMSDESILKDIEISQSGRFYHWRVKSLPIPRREIETHSANMHLIPADDSVKRAISRIRKGDIVEISGSLVNVRSDSDGWYWKSSKTRDDTGSGACELIWVESLYIVTR